MKRAMVPVLFLAMMILLASCYPPPVAYEQSKKTTLTLAKPRHTLLFPLMAGAPHSYRIGFAGLPTTAEGLEAANAMRAGWYYSWWVYANPSKPEGVEYVQLINLHQKLTCPLRSTDAHDRSKCPYAQPLDYVLSQDRATIAGAVRKKPGSLWLIGNEMDIRDTPGSGQNETLPETYAVAYHDLYTLIKSNDPGASVAIGGVVEPTPMRLEYLTKVWDAYQLLYGTPMPVDVWNVHNYILSETAGAAEEPPGNYIAQPVVYSPIETGSAHVSMAIFDQQIRAMRAWMKDRGQQNKPLIVSEYGVLYPAIPEADTLAEVENFLAATNDYFMNTRDCNLGAAADECRLVQRWAWFSFQSTCCNQLARLFDPNNKQLSTVGERLKKCAVADSTDDWLREMGMPADARQLAGCQGPAVRGRQ